MYIILTDADSSKAILVGGTITFSDKSKWVQVLNISYIHSYTSKYYITFHGHFSYTKCIYIENG